MHRVTIRDVSDLRSLDAMQIEQKTIGENTKAPTASLREN